MNGTSRDVGLKSPGAGKGSAPRNMSAKFYENFDAVDFQRPGHAPLGRAVYESACGFQRRGNKLRKVYRCYD